LVHVLAYSFHPQVSIVGESGSRALNLVTETLYRAIPAEWLRKKKSPLSGGLLGEGNMTDRITDSSTNREWWRGNARLDRQVAGRPAHTTPVLTLTSRCKSKVPRSAALEAAYWIKRNSRRLLSSHWRSILPAAVYSRPHQLRTDFQPSLGGGATATAASTTKTDLRASYRQPGQWAARHSDLSGSEAKSERARPGTRLGRNRSQPRVSQSNFRQLHPCVWPTELGCLRLRRQSAGVFLLWLASS